MMTTRRRMTGNTMPIIAMMSNNAMITTTDLLRG